ncbi:MAG: dienelactone hydrolase family protein, partial [Candidatus Eisenbacteria bacterium]|nr:dienelactone hydrolase family protein [Candidatus Eisenbacteria bacterium]
MHRLVPVLLCATWFACGDLAGAAAKPVDLARAAVSDTARVHLGAAGAGAEAFVALPGGQGPAPGLIVIHEWWGLNAQIREVARRLALQGYVAIVPDLYHG